MTPLSITVIEESLAAGPYAFPGGYPKYFVMADGEALSHSAAKDCLEDIHSAHRGAAKRPDQPNSWDSQWIVIGEEVNYEDASLTCAHTGQPIEAAYA